MDEPPFIVSLIVNKECSTLALMDSSYLSYDLINSRFTSRYKLQRIRISHRLIVGFSDLMTSQILEITKIEIDLNGYKEDVFFYVVLNLASYDIILGLPQMKRNDVRLSLRRAYLYIRPLRIRVLNTSKERPILADYGLVSVAAFSLLVRRRKRQKNIQVFLASLTNIDKALSVKKITDPRTKLPSHFHEFLDVFDRTEAEKLPPLRERGIDHSIELL